MAHKVKQVDLGPPDPEDDEVDSQIVITLVKDERVPRVEVTKAGRMTGQMVMGMAGEGMMRIDNALRMAQRAIRAPLERNTKLLAERVMQTKENSDV